MYKKESAQQQKQSYKKVSLPLYDLQKFYKHLIPLPIRPSFNNFFKINPKIDIQDKFSKYPQDYQNNQRNQDYKNKSLQLKHGLNAVQRLNQQTGKYIVFRINQSRIKDSQQKQGKIATFTINLGQKGKNITNIANKNQDEIQNMFFQEEAFYYLISGCLQLHKISMQQTLLVQNKSKQQHKSEKKQIFDSLISRNFKTFTNFISYKQLSSTINRQEKQAQIISSAQMRIKKQLSTSYKKYQQIKQNHFFTLLNYRNLTGQKQYYKLVPKSKCIIGMIPIRKRFGYQYLVSSVNKLETIARMFGIDDRSDYVKSQNFKSIFQVFQQQNYRKDINLSTQNQQNSIIHILSHLSQTSLYKNAYFQAGNNVQGLKNIFITNVNGPAIFNAQKYLIDNTNINKSIQNKSLRQLDSQIFNIGQQNTNQPLNKRQLNNKKNKQTIQQKANILGNNQAYCKFLPFSSNCSTFTIKSQSAYIKTYSISVKQFDQIIPQRLKNNFIKKYQQLYTNYIDKCKRKLEQFQKQIHLKNLLKNKDLQQYAALIETQHNSTQQINSNENKIKISPSKLQFYNKQCYHGLKRNQLAYEQGLGLQKRIQIMRKSNKQKFQQKNIISSYKTKIQNLITKNLSVMNNLQYQNQDQKTQSTKVLLELYKKNISNILMQQNHQHKSQQILLHDIHLTKRKQIMNQNYHIKQEQHDIFIDKEEFDPKFNKIVKINLLRKGHPDSLKVENFLKGVQMDHYTKIIKSNLSNKINKTNKIKEQFMKIQSKCLNCHCYDDLDSYKALTQRTTQHRTSIEGVTSHDPKFHTMKIGVNWRTRNKSSHLGDYDERKTAPKTSYDPRRSVPMTSQDQPFQKVYNRIKVLKQKSMEKFSFKNHLQAKSNVIMSRRQRKKSAPIL